MDSLIEIKKYAEEIAGQWNGESERGEEKAQIANEIIEKIDELNQLLAELEDF